MRRGLLFTAALGFLAVSLIGLASDMGFYMVESRKPALMASATQRVNEAFNSAGFDLRDIVLETSGLKIQYMESNITFNETIPNSAQAAKYKDNIDLYLEIGGNQSADMQFFLNELRNNLRITVEPGGLNYTHTSFGGNTIKINTSSNVVKYNISLVTDKNITSCAWNIDTTGDQIPLAVHLRTTLEGSEFEECDEVRNVGLEGESIFNANQYNLTINMTGGQLIITNDWNTQLEVSTRIYLDPSNNISGVYIPDGTVEASLNQYGIQKRGKIRLY
jgi:hypothetical protein